ncbi:MAG: DUF2793 domain-containing protein [Pseudomonadota bacterium]
MSDPSANLSLPFIQPAQAQKHITHNEALVILDAVVQLAVVSSSETAAPAMAADGARYIVPPGATGDWAGQEDRIAVAGNGTWQFLMPQTGWRAFVADLGSDLIWRDGVWQSSGFDNLPGVGINASADATNRLAVASGATLLNHEGAGHQLKINKALAGDTASLLFQTGFSGRAEMGIAGTDDFALKTSSDGSTWATALQAAPDGSVDLGLGSSVVGQGIYHRGNLVGTVGQTGGLPDGAMIEQGSTADGGYVRFADGTQICWTEVDVEIDTAVGAVFTSGTVTVDFPVPFAAPPAGSGAMANTAEAWVNGRAGSTTQWQAAAFSHAVRSGDRMQLIAVGRWV